MELDPFQQLVTNHKDGHALVLAGAGSGKTACVTVRAATRLFDGLESDRMLLLTFTNKACREMKDRLAGILEQRPGTKMPLVSTFHAFGHRLIRKYPKQCHRRPNVSMLDPDDTESILKQILMDVGIPKEFYKVAIQTFSMVRNDGLNAMVSTEKEAIMRLFEETGHFSYEECDRLVDVGRRYEDRKRQMNLIDFDDLINLPIQALRENPELRAQINQQLADVTVDEAQDNNKAQYKLLKLIAGKTVVMVGDDDQSVHRWRGAHPEGLEQFQNKFSPEVFRLERNYRSLPVIVESATRLIRHNEDRMEKNPYPTRKDDSRPIPCHVHRTGDLMAERIALDLKKRIEDGMHPSKAAILYRTNAMAKALEPSLLRHGIPYRIKKGFDLMSHAEIKMLMAGARLAVNPYDVQAFTRIAQLIPGFGAKSIEKMEAAAGDIAILDAIDAAPKKNQEALVALRSSLASLYHQGPEKLVAWAMGPAGLKPWLQKEAERAVKTKDKTLRGKAFDEAVHEGLSRRVARLKIIQETIAARLTSVTEGTGRDDRWAEVLDMLIQPPDEDPETGAVILSTVHGSKGLQWDTVHIAGFSEGLMPFEKNGEIQNMTEERCLAYVGMTRAENNLFLHHPKSLDLKMGGGAKDLSMSRFISEALESDQKNKAIEVVSMDKTRRSALSKRPTIAGLRSRM